MTRALQVLIFFILASLLQSGCAPYLLIQRGVVDGDKLAEIKTEVVKLRGLKFKNDFPIEIKSKAAMKRYLERDLDQEYGDEKLRNLGLTYAKLGLFPRAIDLKKSYLDFYDNQVAAFYDPRAKKLVLPERLSGGFLLSAFQFIVRRDLLGEMVLAHELTHALQDQHFSLGERLKPSNDGDRTLALRAVAEGDATLSGFGYLYGGMDESSAAQTNQAVQRSIAEARSELTEVPEPILEELLFQYYGGVSFVSRVVVNRGWLGVDFLYRFPPLSTEQILHPEKYFDSPDPPTRIELGELSALFPPPWQKIEDNVLGELMVGTLFKRFIPDEQARSIAEGWDGDRLIAYRSGEEVAFAWVTAWDSLSDAGEFFQAYRQILAEKYGAETARLAYIEQRGQTVVIIEGVPLAQVEKHVKSLWQGMVLKKEPFKLPFPGF